MAAVGKTVASVQCCPFDHKFGFIAIYLFYFRLIFKIKINLQSQVIPESYPVETVIDIFIIKKVKFLHLLSIF